MKKPIFYFLLILLFPVISCDNPSSSGDTITKGYVWETSEEGDSVLMHYDDKGKLTAFSTYKNGLKNGIAKKFYDNNNTEFVIPYLNGIKNGKVLWFYENGKLYRETHYLAGQKHGAQKLFYDDGNLMAEIPYSYDKIQPGLKEYTKSGKLKKIYPDLNIEPVNNLAFEDKYILRCRLSNNSKKAKYFRRLKIDSEFTEFWAPLENKKGYADIDFFIRKGGYVMGKELIRVEYKTVLGNTYVIEKEYNVAVDN
nr:hypothetical protein [Bacteroidota bacterium]